MFGAKPVEDSRGARPEAASPVPASGETRPVADGNRSGARGTAAAKGNMRAEHLKQTASTQPEPQTRVIGRARVCGDGVTRGSGEARRLARCHHPCPTTEFPPAALPRHFACCEPIASRILRLDSPSRWVCLRVSPRAAANSWPPWEMAAATYMRSIPNIGSRSSPGH